jgi:hypothetical protein
MKESFRAILEGKDETGETPVRLRHCNELSRSGCRSGNGR